LIACSYCSRVFVFFLRVTISQHWTQKKNLLDVANEYAAILPRILEVPGSNLFKEIVFLIRGGFSNCLHEIAWTALWTFHSVSFRTHHAQIVLQCDASYLYVVVQVSLHQKITYVK
jgi:hypothetical protein